MTPEQIKEVIDFYMDDDTQGLLKGMMSQVEVFFENNSILNKEPLPIIHSMKSRLKNVEHLKDKITRKEEKGVIVTPANLFQEVTDLAGVRICHLYQDQFREIHQQIIKKIDVWGDWTFIEEPKAYTWDPESQRLYEELGIRTEVRDTYYTSVHYVVTPNNKSNPSCCEIQVRTLFEEIWGEIDHTINYPHKTESVACKEQLRVLAKLVSTGTRLADSIFRSYNDYNMQ